MTKYYTAVKRKDAIMEDKCNFVQCWGMAHSPLSLMYFPEAARTFRIIVNTAISGKGIRVRLSNRHGKETVTIGAVTAALCYKDGTVPENAEFVRLRLSGEDSFFIYPGQRITTDPTAFVVSPNDFLCVSVFVREGALSSGNSLNNMTLLFCEGNASESRVFKAFDRKRSKVIASVTGLLGICHPLPVPLFEDIELDNYEGAKAIVCFGDSLIQQGFWSNVFDKKIRETYPGKYSVINKAIGGNRLMRDSKFILKGLFGISAMKRVEEDIFAYDNISHAIVCIGLNDMLQPGSIAAPISDRAPADEYEKALTELFAKFREKGIKTIGMNYVAFGGSMDARKSKHEIRRLVNAWFAQNTDICDRFVDIYTPTVSDKPDYMKKEYLGKDNLHPNALGGEVIAAQIPIDFFKE